MLPKSPAGFLLRGIAPGKRRLQRHGEDGGASPDRSEPSSTAKRNALGSRRVP